MAPESETASHICMSRCRGMCCRGPLILRLGEDEVGGFQEQARSLGVEARITTVSGGEGWVRFADHPGERCPMLEDGTSACRIYEDRPRRCRQFPERLTQGCLLSELRFGRR